MKPATARRLNAPVMIGLALIIMAGVIWWQMRLLPVFAGHSLGAAALPDLVAAGLFVLGALHLLREGRGAATRSDAAPVHVRPVLWIGAGLAMVAAIVSFGGGFIAAIAALFAASSRAFGRRAVVADLAIGAVLALCVYLAFVKLLGLTLPTGPLESLL